MEKETQPTALQSHIAKVTLHLIAKKGYKATTTREIARAAEVNESTLFKNFGSKLDLFLWAKERETQRFTEELHTFFLSSPFLDLSAFFKQSGKEIYRLFLFHSDLVTIFYRELGNEELLLGQNTLLELTVSQLYANAVPLSKKRNHFPITPFFLLVSGILNLVLSQSHKGSLTDELPAPVTIDTICHEAVRMASAGLI